MVHHYVDRINIHKPLSIQFLRAQKVQSIEEVGVCQKSAGAPAGGNLIFFFASASLIGAAAHLLHHHNLLLLFQKGNFFFEWAHSYMSFSCAYVCVYVLLGITHLKSVNDNYLCGLEDTFSYPSRRRPAVIYFCFAKFEAEWERVCVCCIMWPPLAKNCNNFYISSSSKEVVISRRLALWKENRFLTNKTVWSKTI